MYVLTKSILPAWNNIFIFLWYKFSLTNGCKILFRMDSHGQFDSSSSPTGQSKVCPSQGKDSLISLAKYIKQRNSLVRRDPLVYIAGTAIFNLYCSLSKFSRWQFDVIFHICLFFFLENRLWHFMQIVPKGDNLHEMSKLNFWGKNKNVSKCPVCWKFKHWYCLFCCECETA